MVDNKRKKVIIIGAGIAGLTCAKELVKYQDQFDVKILEASDRTGGRIKSHIAEDGTVLELGAHYIHGTADNPIYDFCVEKGIIVELNEQQSTKLTATKVISCFPKELQLSQEIKENSVEIGFDIAASVLLDLSKSHPPNICFSLGDYFDTSFSKALEKQNFEMVKALSAVFNHIAIEECNSNGCSSLYHLDLQSYGNYVDLKGNLFFIPTCNYSKVVEVVEDDIPKEIIIKNHEVCKVKKTTDENGDLFFNVLCTNSEVFTCDVVVLTVSLEVLKSMCLNDAFQPSLEEEKTSALEHMGLSNVVKLFFKFQTPVSRDISCFNFFPHTKRKNPTNSGSVTSDWNCDDIIDDISISSLDRIKKSDWWLCWVPSDFVAELREKGPYEFLTNAFHYFTENYEDFPKDVEIDPKSLFYNDWTEDPFYQGGYSFIKVGGNSVSDIPKLQEPVVYGDEKKIYLFLSGEMTSLEFYSTTHSGYVSGLREAERIKQIFL